MRNQSGKVMLTLYIALAAFALYTAALALGRGYEVIALFLVYVLLVPVLVRQVVRFVDQRTYSRYAPRIAGVFALAVLGLMPFWDAIAGRIYFNYLCETDGGVKVYETVRLGPGYYNEDGSARFAKDKNTLGMVMRNYGLHKKTIFDETYGGSFNITLDKDVIYREKTNEILGSKASFIYFGGWLINSIGLHPSGSRCHGYTRSYYEDFLRHIFLAKQ